MTFVDVDKSLNKFRVVTQIPLYFIVKFRCSEQVTSVFPEVNAAIHFCKSEVNGRSHFYKQKLISKVNGCIV